VAAELEKAKDGLVATVFGDTPGEQRAWALQAFKDRMVRFLVNVDVLTTGFDAPGVDCVALLRPTLSPGLYYQMVGRGFRTASGKQNCLVLDFGGNVIRHGPIGDIAPWDEPSGGKASAKDVKARECPDCGEMIALRHRTCPACGVTIGELKAPHATTAADADPVEAKDLDVSFTDYSRHIKRDNPNATPTLRVDYYVGFMDRVSEWVCIEHQGYAGGKARQWWAARCRLPFPASVNDALSIAQAHALAEPTKISIAKDGKYWRVMHAELGEIPYVEQEEPDDTSMAYAPCEENIDVPF
jgi:DNA repair protein RadD